MKLNQRVGVTAIFLASPLLSFANEVYVGAKVGGVHGHNACESHRITCDNNAFGMGLFMGYELLDWLGLEAGYNYFGKIKASYPALDNSNIAASYSGKVQGIDVGAKPYWMLNDSTSISAKVGSLAWWTDVTGQEINYRLSASNNGWSPMLGVGIETKINSNLSARLEYQWFHNVGGDTTGGGSINMFSAGVVYRFNTITTEPAVMPPSPH